MKEKYHAAELVAQMTLEEKVSLCSGADMFATQEIERLGIPAIHMADGPHGLRKQEGAQDFMGKNGSVTATCFPAACLTGAGFDSALLERMGHMLGKICRAKDVQVLLGPGINIKRSPLCGRNFEYFSEDPLVSGTLGTAYVRGLQAEGVGASLKHFFANNQETRRRTQSSNLDERTMREIYLSAFEQVVKEAQPWTVMSSYNKVNGTYVNETSGFCKNLLKGEWGFEGMMVSDWAAVHDRVAAVKAGCALTMPGDKENDVLLSEAVHDGVLSMEELDECCTDIVALVLHAKENYHPDTAYDFEEAHTFAKQIAGECMVLLKNEGQLLPISSSQKIAVIGRFAVEPRYQGAGSSKVNPYRVSVMPEVTAAFPNVVYADGFGMGDAVDEALQSQAVELAKWADVAVVIAGLPPVMEGEGYDRWVMKLPKCQNDLIEKVCEVQKNTVIVLQNGGAVEMPWADKPKAILEAYLGGEAVSEAIWEVLTGEIAPSGHLAETFPKRYEDTPGYLTWPGEGDSVPYTEGVFVGYRYYESRGMEVLFPFGHGLTYTEFSYSDLNLSQDTFVSGETITAQVTVTNKGNRPGKALVQMYVGTDVGAMGIRRPIRELRGFEKVFLMPGESKPVVFKLDKRSFAHWDMEAKDWRIAGGRYEVQIGASASDILLRAAVNAENEYLPTGKIYDIMTSIGEVSKHPIGKAFMAKVQPMVDAIIAKMGMGSGIQQSMPYAELRPKEAGFLSEPMQTVKRMLPNVSEKEWDELFRQMNQGKASVL